MDGQLNAFNPASWHEAGVVVAQPPARKPRKERVPPKLQERVIQASKSVALTAAATVLFCVSMSLGDTSESLPLGAGLVRTSADTKVDRRVDSDYVDPAKWGRLVALLNKLPTSERSDPPGLPPPLV